MFFIQYDWTWAMLQKQMDKDDLREMFRNYVNLGSIAVSLYQKKWLKMDLETLEYPLSIFF